MVMIYICKLGSNQLKNNINYGACGIGWLQTKWRWFAWCTQLMFLRFTQFGFRPPLASPHF